MNYTPEFKAKIDETFKYHSDHPKIMAAMYRNEHNTVRNILEDSLEDPDLIIDKEIEDDGSRIIVNAKIKNKKKREKLYSEFMKHFVKNII